MLGSNGSSDASAVSESPPDSNGDTIAHTSSPEMFSASVESLMITLRQTFKGAGLDAAKGANGNDPVVLE